MNPTRLQWNQVPCAGKIDLFMSHLPTEQEQAITICGDCKSNTKQACLDLGWKHEWGVYGGKTAKARSNMRKNATRDRRKANMI